MTDAGGHRQGRNARDSTFGQFSVTDQATAGLAPGEAFDRPPERREDLRGEVVRAQRGGPGRLPPEGRTDDRRAAPGSLGIFRRGHEPEPDLEPPGVLED